MASTTCGGGADARDAEIASSADTLPLHTCCYQLQLARSATFVAGIARHLAAHNTAAMSSANAVPLGARAAAPTGRAKRELEEARKAGTLAPEVDAVTG